MIECSFELNGNPMSSLNLNGWSFPAFSGLGKHANRRAFACFSGTGPIPPGRYYIFDRQSGGLLGPLRDIFKDHRDWFALYAIDERIDDEVFCNRVKRGNFRLHPKGPLGVSQGCITLENPGDFQKLRAILKSAKSASVHGTDMKAYGRVIVR